jgi:GT2 family glycosyltransferase
LTGGPRHSCSVLVPSYRRPSDLARCLDALAGQAHAPDQVVVVVRPDDLPTRETLGAARSTLPITEVLVERTGQVAALNAGLAAVTSDLTAITDDDTAPHPDWLERVLAHFADEAVAGVGGRDLVFGSNRPPMPIVGQVGPQGRIVGNHHRGTGPPRSVDVLKGSNMAFRTAWLRRFWFDERLRGSGAQVHNDLQLSLRIRAAGGTLIYDAAVLVDHYPAARPAGDTRAGIAFGDVRDEVHNETLALMEFLSPVRRVAYLLWSGVIGTRRNPGIARVTLSLPARKWHVCEAFAGCVVGRVLGVKSWL